MHLLKIHCRITSWLSCELSYRCLPHEDALERYFCWAGRVPLWVTHSVPPHRTWMCQMLQVAGAACTHIDAYGMACWWRIIGSQGMNEGCASGAFRPFEAELAH